MVRRISTQVRRQRSQCDRSVARRGGMEGGQAFCCKGSGAIPDCVLGNDTSAQAYGIGNMPDTFLIDQEGRIAATYVGMVDKNGLEKNIENLLAQK